MTRIRFCSKTIAYVVNRLRREAARHIRERTDYHRTRAEELRHQATVIESRAARTIRVRRKR